MVYQTLNSCTHLYTIETSFWVKSASLAPKSNRGLHIRRRLGHVIIWPARLQPTQLPKLVWLGCWFNGQLKNKFSLNNFLRFLLRNDTCVLASNKDVWPSFIAFFLPLNAILLFNVSRENTQNRGSASATGQAFHANLKLSTQKHRICNREDAEYSVGLTPMIYIEMASKKANTEGLNHILNMIHHLTYMVGSWNGVTPKSSSLLKCSIINHPFWGALMETPYIQYINTCVISTYCSQNISHNIQRFGRPRSRRRVSGPCPLGAAPSWTPPAASPWPQSGLKWCWKETRNGVKHGDCWEIPKLMRV